MKNKRVDWQFIRWAGLVFALALGVLFLFRDTVREEVLNPVLYLFWVGWLILGSIDQRVLWGGLWLILLLVGARSLFPERKPTAPGFGGTHFGAEPGRVQYWATQLAHAGRNEFFYQDARLAIQRLMYSALASREGISPEEVALQIERGEIQIPIEVRELLKAGKPGQAPVREGFLERITNAIQTIKRRSQAIWARSKTTEVDPRWEQLVRYIEAQWEREDRHESE